MKLDRSTILVLVAAVAVGYWMAGGSSPQPNPLTPEDRPVLRWLARAAKSALWIMLVAEQPPAEPAARQLVHAEAIGADGYPRVDHGRGW